MTTTTSRAVKALGAGAMIALTASACVANNPTSSDGALTVTSTDTACTVSTAIHQACWSSPARAARRRS